MLGRPSLPTGPGQPQPYAQWQVKMAWPDVVFGSYQQVSGLWTPSVWLWMEFEVQHKGRLWWRKPCWDGCPVVVQPEKEERVLPSVQQYRPPDSTNDGCGPPCPSFEEGVKAAAHGHDTRCGNRQQTGCEGFVLLTNSNDKSFNRTKLGPDFQKQNPACCHCIPPLVV